MGYPFLDPWAVGSFLNQHFLSCCCHLFVLTLIPIGLYAFSVLFFCSITGQNILKLFASQNKRGCNPLMTAAEFESNDVLQFLLHYLKGLVISKGIFNLVPSSKKINQDNVPQLFTLSWKVEEL